MSLEKLWPGCEVWYLKGGHVSSILATQKPFRYSLQFDSCDPDPITVNVVIFAGENFAKKLARHFTWGNFHNYTPISFIKAYGFKYRMGGIFAKKKKA